MCLQGDPLILFDDIKFKIVSKNVDKWSFFQRWCIQAKWQKKYLYLIKSPENDHFCKMTFTEDRRCTDRTRLALDHYRRLNMQFKIFKANSPAHKRETLDIQTFNTVLGTSFTLSLLRLFLAPCQAWIKRKTPQTPSFTSLPEWASNSELSERIRPQKCTDAFETGCWHWRQPSTSCFVPCFPPMLFHKLNVDKLFQLKSSFFNSNPAFSTPNPAFSTTILLFQPRMAQIEAK